MAARAVVARTSLRGSMGSLRAKDPSFAALLFSSAARIFSQIPRHAAAAALVFSLGCNGGETKNDIGVMEAPPPPMDMQVKHDMGVIEAPPPPMDTGVTVDSGVKDDMGVIEAPPPPVDSGVKEDIGVMEAPPPPFDAGNNN